MLRQDNADRRLTPTGYRVGLISQERYDQYLKKQRLIEEERQRVAQVSVPLTDTIQQILTAKGTAPLKTGCKLEELLRRPPTDLRRFGTGGSETAGPAGSGV